VLILDTSMKSKPINKAEQVWIENNLTAVRSLITSLDGSDGAITPDALDRAYEAWFSGHRSDTEDPNPMINAFGIAFGRHLVDTLTLQWAIVKEQGRSDLAVVGQPGDIVVVPANLVAKRYTRGETGFFSALYQEMKATIATVRSQPARKKPWWKPW